MKDSIDDALDYINYQIKTQGQSVVTVKDGWIFTFSRDRLRDLLSKHPEEENLVIFVKGTGAGAKN